MARGQVIRDTRVRRDRRGRKLRRWVWCVSREPCYLAGLMFERTPYLKVGLKPIEAKVMAALMLCELGYVSKEDLGLFVYPDPNQMPDSWRQSIEVVISSLRLRVRHTGIKIKNIHSRGWELVIA